MSALHTSVGCKQVVRCKSKIRGVAFPAKRAKTDAVHCALALANNSIEASPFVLLLCEVRLYGGI